MNTAKAAGRPRVGDEPMTAAERKRRSRANQRAATLEKLGCQVQESRDICSGELLCYYARGHWAEEVFSAAIQKQWGPVSMPSAAQCSQRYARICGDWSDGYQPVIKWERGPGRGAFPVTVIEF